VSVVGDSCLFQIKGGDRQQLQDGAKAATQE